MTGKEGTPSSARDSATRRLYRLTPAGMAERDHPTGRVSRGFLRLMAVLDGRRDLRAVQAQLNHLTIGDLVLWCDELSRHQWIERVDRGDGAGGEGAFAYTGAIEFERDPGFAAAFDEVISALNRSPAVAARGAVHPTEAKVDKAQTARLVAIEALNTTRNITLNGFFAYPSRRADGKVKPSEFRILIVQDEQKDTYMANQVASKAGYITAVAHSLATFRAALRAQLRPDLVLLDVDLPDGNGFDELEALRAKPDYAKLCVVMLTARSDQADIARGVVLGANGYVTKPYTAETLQSAIRKALNLA